jgi:hypothetical protein
VRHLIALSCLAFAACVSPNGASAAVPGAAEVMEALSVCASKPVVHTAKCQATGDPTEFLCTYILRDGALEGAEQQTVIAADGGKFVLIDIPNHCEVQ